MLPGTGPYILNEADVQKGKSVTLRRRKDYWARSPDASRLNNFDELRELSFAIRRVRDDVQKGDLDYFYIIAPTVGGRNELR